MGVRSNHSNPPKYGPGTFCSFHWISLKLPHLYAEGVCPECIDIWDWNMGDEGSKSAKSGEDGTNDGEMDVHGVAEG